MVIDKIRKKWRLLRLMRSRGTVLIDYRILQNLSHILRRAA